MRVGPARVARLGVVVVVLALGGCASATGSIGPTISPTASILPPASSSPGAPSAAAASPSPSGAASDAVPASPVVGVVVALDSAGLSQVRGFTLRLAGGRQLAFTIGTLENAASFPPGHLSEHMASASPVRVFFRQSGGSLVVYRIEDAG